MTEHSFDLFCPKCNILVSAQVIGEANAAFHSEAIGAADYEDAPYTSDHYSIAICGRCDQPFLVHQRLSGVPAEFETVIEQNLLYPSDSHLPLEHVPAPVSRAYEQATRSFSTGLYEPCTLMCRKTLDAAATSLGASGGSLNTKLKTLHESGQIDQRLLDWAHAVRLLGNEAAHDPDAEVSKEDARDVLDFTEAILIYVFILNRRLERLRARREYQ